MADTNTKIKNDIQKLTPETEYIDLYVLDATSLGGGMAYFVPGTISNVPVVFNGITYSPLPVEIDGIEVKGDGTLPRPKMRVANVTSTFVGIVYAYEDGIGALVKRLRTFKKYLDGQSGADYSAQFPMDTFIIEQKTAHNNVYIEWELVCPMDIGTKMLPRNQVMSYCQHRYRINGVSTALTTCPYTGTRYYTEDGNTTTAANDVCGKKLYDCKLRYPGLNEIKPMKGFPGIGTVSSNYR